MNRIKTYKKHLAVIAIFLTVTAGLAGYLWYPRIFAIVMNNQGNTKEQKSNRQANEVKGREEASFEPQDEYEKVMLAAAVKYWSESGGDPEARVVLKNFGCHIGIEAVKNNQTVARMSYDGSNITIQ